MLSAAASLAYIKFEEADESLNREICIRDQIARGQELIKFLLDRGVSARTLFSPPRVMLVMDCHDSQ